MNAATDLLRLCSLPVLAWAAVRDLRTRRVPNRTWLPLGCLGAGLLAWDGLAAVGGPPVETRLFALRVGLSLCLVAPLGVACWWLGAFGGADAKALAALCLLFPTPPAYLVAGVALPLWRTSGLFSLSVLTDAVAVAAVVPLFLFVRNALAGRISLSSFVGHPVPWRAVPGTHGRLLARANDLDVGLDLDALRMYLRWRDASLTDLRAAPATARNPASLPTEPNPPGDGAVRAVTDGGTPDDPWGAAAFLDDAGSAYGATPTALRAALDALVADESVWVSPGLPFLVALFVGLCLALVAGDPLASLGALG